MKIRIRFFATFRELFGTKEMEKEVKGGTTIGEVLHLLFNTQQRQKEIFDNGKLRPYIIVLRNGRHIQHLNGLETELQEGDNIAVFPPVAGG